MPSPLPHLRSVVTEDGAVILDILNNQILSLNSIGGYIWNKLQQGVAISEIVRTLSDESGVDSLAVERDVYAFIEQLTARHLFQD